MLEQAFQKMSEWISVASPLFLQRPAGRYLSVCEKLSFFSGRADTSTICPSFQSSQIGDYRTPGTYLVIRCSEGRLSFELGPGKWWEISG